jgi:LysR family hydrogen peroxide-inducible transcriptional activator
MELHQLRYFVAAAEAGSISRAAERCHVSQPSLSQQLKKLEDELGVLVFDRLGRGIVPTDAGRALLPRARRILAEIRDIEQHLRHEAEEGPGPLIVGAIPTIAPYLLPRAIEQVRNERPDCEISIREGLTEELVEALVDNAIDCALTSTPIDHEQIQLEVLGSEELLVVTSASHALGDGSETVGIEALRGRPTVTLEEMHCLGQQIQGFCASRNLAPRIVCTATQLATIFELVNLGLGLSIVPEMAAAGRPKGGLRYLHLKQHRPQRQIAVAWRRDRSRPKAAERLVAAVKAGLAQGWYRFRRDA